MGGLDRCLREEDLSRRLQRISDIISSPDRLAEAGGLSPSADEECRRP
jgi:hypothetical protein